MTIQIRRGVFETNSSSTHSLTMCLAADYAEWKSGKVYLNNGGGWSLSVNAKKQFVTKDELIEILTNSKYPPTVDLASMDDDEFYDFLNEDREFFLYDDFFNGDLEDFEDTFVTPSGETVIAFGRYGYNG